MLFKLNKNSQINSESYDETILNIYNIELRMPIHLADITESFRGANMPPKTALGLARFFASFFKRFFKKLK